MAWRVSVPSRWPGYLAVRGYRSGGSWVVSRLGPEDRAERGAWVGCIAGALSVGEYRRGLTDAGFTDVEIVFTREVVDGVHSAIVRACKPSG